MHWASCTAAPPPSLLVAAAAAAAAAAAVVTLARVAGAERACLMVQRAVEIRGQPFGVSLVPFGETEPASPYAMTARDRAREDRCLAPYRDDPRFGTASLKRG